jgi:hypothetical protein
LEPTGAGRPVPWVGSSAGGAAAVHPLLHMLWYSPLTALPFERYCISLVFSLPQVSLQRCSAGRSPGGLRHLHIRRITVYLSQVAVPLPPRGFTPLFILSSTLLLHLWPLLCISSCHNRPCHLQPFEGILTLCLLPLPHTGLHLQKLL